MSGLVVRVNEYRYNVLSRTTLIHQYTNSSDTTLTTVMRCANHPNVQPAVQSCNDCGKGLCQPCANTWNPSLCTPCALRRFSRQKQQAIGVLISLTLAFFLGGYFFTHGNPYAQVEKGRVVYFMLMGAISAGTIAGWRYLKSKQDNRSRIVWFSPEWHGIYLVLRLGMSVFIGTFMLPYAIYTAVNELIFSLKAESVLRATKQDISV